MRQIMPLVTIGASRLALGLGPRFPVWRRLGVAAMHALLQPLFDEPVTLGAGRANMGNIQRRARIGCWQDAVAAVAVDANGGNRQSRFAEALPRDAHQKR